MPAILQFAPVLSPEAGLVRILRLGGDITVHISGSSDMVSATQFNVTVATALLAQYPGTPRTSPTRSSNVHASRRFATASFAPMTRRPGHTAALFDHVRPSSGHADLKLRSEHRGEVTPRYRPWRHPHAESCAFPPVADSGKSLGVGTSATWRLSVAGHTACDPNATTWRSSFSASSNVHVCFRRVVGARPRAASRRHSSQGSRPRFTRRAILTHSAQRGTASPRNFAGPTF